MGLITAVLYGGLVVYLGGWYFNHWVGNFALLLFILSVVSGVYWVAERWHFAPKRRAAAAQLKAQDAARRAELARKGIAHVDGDISAAHEALLRQPWWLDWTAGLFPVILAVFLLRSFLFEPFKIPSGSMIPTLESGDLILVNKFHYGVRLPVINKKIIANEDPKRGDVVVFRYPPDPRVDYIKRVVGVPGDTISYLNHELRINGQPVPTTPLGEEYDDERMRYMTRFTEQLGSITHRIQREAQPVPFGGPIRVFPHHEACQSSIEGVTCTVPPGSYFMMGDNRDNSEDSRYWGFVPDENIVGRAFFVWMNFGKPSRIGSFN